MDKKGHFMKKPNKLLIPRCKDEGEERNFWHKNDASLYFDLAKARHVSIPNLKPSTASIHFRD